jgi:uncharacterized protein DUF2442
MMPRVKRVVALPQYRLHVAFDDGVSGTIDLSDELEGEVFRPLRDEAVLRQVTADEFGAVCWPNGPDLAPDAMHSRLLGETGDLAPVAIPLKPIPSGHDIHYPFSARRADTDFLSLIFRRKDQMVGTA